MRLFASCQLASAVQYLSVEAGGGIAAPTQTLGVSAPSVPTAWEGECKDYPECAILQKGNFDCSKHSTKTSCPKTCGVCTIKINIFGGNRGGTTTRSPVTLR
mmetsp:Transcript_22173/g.48560  ORF Transcript_22173/g.48560 Transcript_22173/m.48560 type:complete len:102 (-) Transcript_22173:47-352(-)|eukprot:CAMPEP_0204257168 /NCGR_PEP_ID=MMETSP0468-20130131/4249_1 /ASSEMBLY_ACC=CAM_ASM_000383 /TAXON_ID=2969 /ORGANISM="Oxyrrhis marina" /LENGTH=101 /DNA_ID=CAMNT_0051231239 /DNA_START=51 /DNA_END=356 /DNA_ORIENTATION=+